MAPVSQFVTLKKVLGPETTNRFNLYSSIAANVNPAEGYSSGEVQKAIEEVAEQVLPTGYGYEYGGMAREEANWQRLPIRSFSFFQPSQSFSLMPSSIESMGGDKRWGCHRRMVTPVG